VSKSGTSAPREPVLDMDDIQGLVLPGFNKQHQTLVGIRLVQTDEGTNNFRSLLHQFEGITSAKQTLRNRREFRERRKMENRRYPSQRPKAVFIGIAFSYNGIKRLRPRAAEISSEAFKLGLANRSTLLGDPEDNKAEGHPKQWVVGKPGEELDVLFVVAGDERSEVNTCVEGLKDRLKKQGVDITYREDGDIRDDLPGHEHFGFDDGVSQPGIRGLASEDEGDFVTPRYVDPKCVPEAWLFGYPGQDLIWPGEIVLGYPASSPDPLVPGSPSVPAPAWTRNGSFLVFRRLRQDVGLFWRTLRERAKELSSLPGFKNMDEDRLAALLVGRWPSGAPVLRVPTGDVDALGGNPYANNHFRFDSDTQKLPLVEVPAGKEDTYPTANADPAGITCPWAGHIRKVNSRDSGSDMGGRDSSYARRILRLGIIFGKPLKDRYAEKNQDPEKGERGLLFLSAQTSIEEQFEFLCSRWMNDPSRPKMPGGHDMFIGQNGSRDENRTRHCSIFGSGLQQAELKANQQWVIPTGGGYFFVPSLTALRDVLGAKDSH
jgi:Dyp-type peroxidase family